MTKLLCLITNHNHWIKWNLNSLGVPASLSFFCSVHSRTNMWADVVDRLLFQKEAQNTLWIITQKQMTSWLGWIGKYMAQPKGLSAEEKKEFKEVLSNAKKIFKKLLACCGTLICIQTSLTVFLLLFRESFSTKKVKRRLFLQVSR